MKTTILGIASIAVIAVVSHLFKEIVLQPISLLESVENHTETTIHERNVSVLDSNNSTNLITPPKFLPSPGQPAIRPGYIYRWLVASKQKMLATTFIPKVMCSSIREALNMMECNATFRCAEWRKNRKIARPLERINNMTRFAFMRDPLERSYSAYRNADDNPYIRLNNCENTTQCSFEEWVDQLEAQNKTAFANEHFMPANKILQLDKMHYHYYLRFSSPIDQNFFWSNLMGLNQHYYKINVSTKNIDDRNKALSAFNSIKLETFHKLAKLYKDDIDVWENWMQIGTPRVDGEATFLDYYKNAINK